MASSLASPLLFANPIYHFRRRAFAVSSSSSSSSANSSQQSTKLVTFLGRGGSGKTTSAVFAAQHYAMAGLSTCLVIHSQDPTADYLLKCKIGTSPVLCNNNLSAVRLETSKLILEPLNRVKQADAHLNMTQGIVEEELGVLPGMDSIASAFTLERLEILRMIGASSKARLYLKYLRNLAEKTDLGRVAGPSLIRLVDEAMNIRGSRSLLNRKMSAEIWDTLEQMLERGSSAFLQPHKFGCFLVMDPNNPISVSGAFGIAPPHLDEESVERAKQNFFPLPFAFIPQVQVGFRLNWNESCSTHHSSNISSVKSDPANKSMTLFMPGFDKSEIKLYQWIC
ncbi:hypothetical protein ACJW30_08G176700 [Castanea mollissima]